MKIGTWNVNSLKVRLGHVLKWLDEHSPDVLALQETKIRDSDFPVDAFTAAGYEVVYSGQPAYNGVAIATRQAPSSDIVTDLDNFEDEHRRVLGATIHGVRVLNLYVPNGQSVDSEKYRYKLAWLAALREHVAEEIALHDRCIVLGDFNIAPEDRDVHDPEKWRGKVLCSESERRAFRALLDLGLSDSFRLFDQTERSFSWWDYRAGAFRRNRGLRIDLVLSSEALSRRCQACTIDKEPRRWERPSDHVPVVAEFTLG
jgi:exodeoxyribonuclease-3